MAIYHLSRTVHRFYGLLEAGSDEQATTTVAMWMKKSRQVWAWCGAGGVRACVAPRGGMPHDPISRNRGARRLGHTV
jgi:hypothetical protein